MRTITRSMASTALAGILVAACGAGAASPTSTPAPTPAAPTATPVSIAPTATPAPTPAKSIGPMDPAYVTGYGTGASTVSEGTTRQDGGFTIAEGVELDNITATMSDPRVSGMVTTKFSEVRSATYIAFMWGTMRIQNEGGAWEGPWKGGSWGEPPESDYAGWLVGSGAYTGLTFYIHVRGHVTAPADVDGVILPAPPPAG